MNPTSTRTAADVAAAGHTLSRSLLDTLDLHHGVAARFHDGSGWSELRYSQIAEQARRLARGLIRLGVEPGDRVAILSDTRVEWTLADLAALFAGAVVVPVYQTNSAGECEHVLADSGARVVFCEDDAQVEKIAPLLGRLPQLEHVITFGVRRSPAIELEDLARAGGAVPDGELDARADAVRPDDPCTIVYTSGTTGAPKGCVLTHANVRSNIDMIERRIRFDAEENVIYLWLPLAHVLARIVQLLALDQGATLAYWRRDTALLLDDVAELQPTHLPSVPRVFEKIYAAATAGASNSRPRRMLLDWAIGVGRRAQAARERARPLGVGLAAQHRLADRLVLRRIRRVFGDRLQFAVTGAAPVDPDILRFFHAAGVYVLEGYGMTETTAVAAVNTIDELRFGTVGRPLPGCSVRIAPDGELLVKGPHVFSGYHDAPDATAEVIDDDGWLATGDLARQDDDGYLTITGRKKDLIITSSGKNVTPASIENALQQQRWISHAVVYGDRRPYLTALIALEPDAPASDPRIREEIQRSVDEVNARFAAIEQVKRFALLDRDLSEEAGELTPTAKVKRQVVYERHRDRLDALYGERTPA